MITKYNITENVKKVIMSYLLTEYELFSENEAKGNKRITL